MGQDTVLEGGKYEFLELSDGPGHTISNAVGLPLFALSCTPRNAGDMKILFFKTSFAIQGDPMGIMQLSAIAQKAGHETGLLLASKDYLDRIEKFKPDLICHSLMTTEFLEVRQAVRNIRRRFPNLVQVAGGPHTTFVPSSINDMEVDAICLGEGDRVLGDILERVEGGRSLDDVSNLHTSQIQNPMRPLVTNLDELPFLDREILYNNSYVNRKFKMRSFFASRGCPYTCTYCFNHAYNKMYRGLGKVVRRRSVDHLLEEMEIVVKKYPTEFIKIVDDLFAYRVDDWIEEFAEKFRKRINLPFYCILRADMIQPELVKVLKYAGCHSAFMSVESGSERIRRDILQRNMSDEQLSTAFDLFNEAGIQAFTNNIVGLPTSTIEDELKTIELNIRCRPAYGQFFVLVPYPGTKVYDYCVEHDMVDPDLKAWEVGKSTGANSVLSCFTEEEKKVQINIMLLGPLVIEFPWLKNLVFKRLIYWKTNILFRAARFFSINYFFQKRIVPVRFSILDYLIMGWSQLKFEINHTREKRKQS